MPVQAVAFDIGGVLEIVDAPDAYLDRWRRRLGLSEDAYQRQLRWPLTQADPGDGARTGAVSEAEMRQRYAAALNLSPEQADAFIADFWDWYCGELDRDLVAFAAGLRPGLRTAILSNSIAGARREEQARHGFEQLVDVIVYSHEVGLAKPDPRVYALLCAELAVAPADLVFLDDKAPNVAAACELGIHGILHVSAAESIAAVSELVSAGR